MITTTGPAENYFYQMTWYIYATEENTMCMEKAAILSERGAATGTDSRVQGRWPRAGRMQKWGGVSTGEERCCVHGKCSRSVQVGSARASALRSAAALGRPEPSQPQGACLAPRRQRPESSGPRADSRASRRGRPRRRGRPGWRGGGRLRRPAGAVHGKHPPAPEGRPGCKRGSGAGCRGGGLVGLQALQRVDLQLQVADLRAEAVGGVDEHKRKRAQVDLTGGRGGCVTLCRPCARQWRQGVA